MAEGHPIIAGGGFDVAAAGTEIILNVKQLAGLLGRIWKRERREVGTSPAAGWEAAAESGEAGSPGRIEALNDNMKKRIKDLGEAINQSLSESEPIADAIARIKAEGYDVFLVLEATIGFNKIEEDEEVSKPAMVRSSASPPDFQITAQDMKFLKQLRIRLDDAA